MHAQTKPQFMLSSNRVVEVESDHLEHMLTPSKNPLHRMTPRKVKHAIQGARIARS